MMRFGRYVMAPLAALLLMSTSYGQTMTDVGTPRHETLIVQTFDGRASNPDAHNPLNAYAIWRGFRELGWSFLWEMDTATGKSYPELAAGPVEVLNPEHTKFRVKIRPGVYWSDGVEFTVDDIIYTLDTSFKYRDKLTFVFRTVGYIKEGSWKKVDNYTFEVETQAPAYDFQTVMGVYTWGSLFVPVPKHIYEPLGDAVVTYAGSPAVTLGPYKVHSFDPNGSWQLWELREDWQRSGWGNIGTPKPKYVLYKDHGAEEVRTLALVQNQYDIDANMSPDSVAAAKARNPAIETFSDTLPYHDMNDACTDSVYINQQRPPFDKAEVRWALALSTDLQEIGINALGGQFKAAALPISDTPITSSHYYDPLEQYLADLTLADGYKPYNPNFGQELVDRLRAEGTPEAELPTGDDVREKFGAGWWKYDPAQAEKLLASVGIKKGSDGFYTMPDGSPWVIELVVPSDWNKVMQRIGFSAADGWRRSGFNVNVRQADNGEFATVQSTNAKNTLMINGAGTCVFDANWLNSWQVFTEANVKPLDSNEPLNGNWLRVTDPEIFALVTESKGLETDSEEFHQNGLELVRKLVDGMQVINLMNIPTPIPTNNTYWTNYPKQDNFYALPYTWWSSFKKTIVNIEPTGAQ